MKPARITTKGIGPALVLLAFLLPPGLAETSDTARHAIAEALQAGQFDRALGLARAALKQSPQDIRILTLEAMALDGTGLHADALSAVLRVLKLSPDYLPALELASQIACNAGDERGTAIVDRLLDLRPEEPVAHALRASMAWRKRDCSTAVRHFSQAAAVIASQPAALQQYGACLVNLKKPDSAIPVLRDALALQPDDAGLRRMLASAQLLAGNAAEAIETLQPLLGAKHPEADTIELSSAAYEASGDIPRAVETLRQAIVLEPRRIELYVEFAALAMDYKSFEVGIDMINAGLKLSPRSAHLFVARGVLYVQLAQYDKAEADFAVAETLDPSEVYGSMARGMAQIQQSNLEEALATVRAKLRRRPDDPFLHYMLAEILRNRGATPGTPEFRQAIAAAERAVQLKPDFVLAHNVLSKLYIDSGQRDRCIEQCRLALHADPSDTTALYRLIGQLRTSGRPQDAAELPALLKRFAAARELARKKDAEQNRYRLMENPAKP